MKVPEVVVFDLGKVLVDFDYGVAVSRIASRCADQGCDLRKVITPEADLLFRYERGEITTEEFFAEVRNIAGFKGHLTEFAQFFADIFSPIEPMVQLNESLRARGIPTYIFSNTNPLAVNHIRDRFPFFKNFTAFVLSYEHGAMKPDEKIYKVVENVTGRAGDAILYLDDRAENIEGGMRRGWQTILQTEPETTLRKIAEMRLLG